MVKERRSIGGCILRTWPQVLFAINNTENGVLMLYYNVLLR